MYTSSIVKKNHEKVERVLEIGGEWREISRGRERKSGRKNEKREWERLASSSTDIWKKTMRRALASRRLHDLALKQQRKPTLSKLHLFNIGLSTHSRVLGSIVVSIPACHAGDRGSTPHRGEQFFFFFKILLLYIHLSKRICGCDSFP